MNLHPRLRYFCDLGCKKVHFLIVNLENNEANDYQDHYQVEILSHGISNFPHGRPFAPM